jgi:hypothetical protein
MVTEQPTELQLRLAYRRIARPGWPPFEKAITTFPWIDVLEPRARQLNRPGWSATHAGPAHSLPTGPVPPTPEVDTHGHARPIGSIARFKPQQRPLAPWPTAGQRGMHSVVGTHDCKRAAANDRDEAA